MINIWLGDLCSYNEGELKGEWLTLPMAEGDLEAKVNLYSRGGEQDYYIADWELPDFLPSAFIKESSDPLKINEMASELECLRDDEQLAVGFLMDDIGLDFEDAMSSRRDVGFYEGCNLTKVAEQLVDDGVFGDFGKNSPLMNYIDYEAIGRDLHHDGYYETPKGVFEYRG